MALTVHIPRFEPRTSKVLSGAATKSIANYIGVCVYVMTIFISNLIYLYREHIPSILLYLFSAKKKFIRVANIL